MKILHITGSLYPAKTGGTDIFVYELAQSLSRNNIHVSVLTTNIGIQNHEVPLNQWIKKNTDFYIHYTSHRFHRFPIRMMWLALFSMHKYDIIHVSSFFYLPSFITGMIAILKGKRVIWSPHGEFSPVALQSRKKFKQLFIKPLPVRKIHFHSTGENETGWIRNLYPHARIIEMPICFRPFNRFENPEMHRDFIFIGRINPIKALEKVLEGLHKSQLFHQSEHKFNIVGYPSASPRYYRKLLDKINKYGLREKVAFKGAINDSYTRDKMIAESRFLLLLSESENFGAVVTEALAQGTPVVASKGTPWKEVAEHNAGFWIDNHPDTIAKTLDKILNMDKATYQAFRKNAGQLFSKRFDLNNRIDEWVNIYKEIYHEQQ